MADDNNQRPYRANETRTAGSGNDPLAELARLIGQTDPFSEYGRDNARRGEAVAEPASAAPAEMPRPQASNYETQNYAGAPLGAGAGLFRTAGGTPAYAAPDDSYSDTFYDDDRHAGEAYDDVAPPPRRMGILAIAAVFALAVIGAAGAFGYRALFGSSGSHMPPPVIKADNTPSKVVPANAKDAQSKQITERLGDHSQNEKMVSREEKPVDVKNFAGMPNAGMPNNEQEQSAPLAPANGSGIVSAEPKKIHTIVIRPDQVGMAPTGATAPAPTAALPTPAARPEPPPAAKPAPMPPQRTANVPPVVAEASAAPSPAPEAKPAVARPVAPAPTHRTAAGGNAPLSLSPGAAEPAPARSETASARPAPPASANGGYAVQVSSQRSEAEAEAAFRNLQAKYPSQLGSRQPMIRRVDLGSKGIYFRAMIGPFANGNEATEVCSSLKSAGGQCIVQKI